ALAQESVQRDRVLLDCVMGAQVDLVTGFRKIEERRHRRFDLVADATDIDHDPRRLARDQDALDATDHRRRLHAVRGMPSRSVLDRVCACAIARASASAASACNLPSRPSSTPTMCWTCALSAPPPPTT